MGRAAGGQLKSTAAQNNWFSADCLCICFRFPTTNKLIKHEIKLALLDPCGLRNELVCVAGKPIALNCLDDLPKSRTLRKPSLIGVWALGRLNPSERASQPQKMRKEDASRRTFPLSFLLRE